MAPVLVLTLKDMGFLHYFWWGARVLRDPWAIDPAELLQPLCQRSLTL